MPKSNMSPPGPSRAQTADDIHFQPRDFDVLRHRPHKTAIHFFNALSATAMFRIWPHLLFMGGWSTMVCCIYILKKYKDIGFPTTMITVLGVLLGLTLSYRTSSAYEKYSQGRALWSQIILASRNWARIVWIHCPDSIENPPPSDPEARAHDAALATLEKKTIVQLALAFAVAVKHYLRGEEGIMYDDLYYLVNFIPTLDLPSALPPSHDVNMSEGLPSLSANRNGSEATTATAASSIQKAETFEWKGREALLPANNPPKFEWKDVFRTKKAAKLDDEGPISRRQNSGNVYFDRPHQNVPLEVAMFMSSWVSTISNRKVLDAVTMTQLHNSLNSLMDALTSLERILTTPIPWSFNAHIWEVSYIYCLLLPFQLVQADFKWVTIPLTVITTYIVFGYASIAEEIENPFGYDKNDLNLGYFCREIIAKELDAITARQTSNPDDWIFANNNWPLGPESPAADRLAQAPLSEIRSRLAMAPALNQHKRSKSSTPQSV